MTREAVKEEIKAKARNSNRKGQTQTHTAPAEQPQQAADRPAIFEPGRGAYWTKTNQGTWIQFTEASLRRRLRLTDYAAIETKEEQVMLIDQRLMDIQLEDWVAYAGPVAGYRKGLWNICGQPVLVTEGPKLIVPRDGDCSLIKSLCEQMLGKRVPMLYGWLKCALRTLHAGPPFRPGQMLALAGPAGAGKSLLQNLITELFGGRSAKPYRYLVGDTAFNADLMRAEHLMIEDEAASTDHRSRRHFATQIKNLIVNETQSLHRKGRDAVSITPFLRVSISLNEEPESLMVLPPMDESLTDKITLLRASIVKFGYDADDLAARKAYREKLSSQLPAFAGFLRAFRIAESQRDQRYGVRAFQEPDLITDLTELAPEVKMLSLIDSLNIWEHANEWWTGTAAELEEKLLAKDRTGRVKDLFSFSTACGVYLERVKRIHPERVSDERSHGKVRSWTIRKPNK